MFKSIKLTTVVLGSKLIVVLWIRTGFNADPDLEFKVNADRVRNQFRIRIQGFHAQKLYKLQEALALKREHSALQNSSFLHFILFLEVIFFSLVWIQPTKINHKTGLFWFIIYLAGTLELLLILLPQKLFAQRYDLAFLSHSLGEGFLFASKFTA